MGKENWFVMKIFIKNYQIKENLNGRGYFVSYIIHLITFGIPIEQDVFEAYFVKKIDLNEQTDILKLVSLI